MGIGDKKVDIKLINDLTLPSDATRIKPLIPENVTAQMRTEFQRLNNSTPADSAGGRELAFNRDIDDAKLVEMMNAKSDLTQIAAANVEPPKTAGVTKKEDGTFVYHDETGKEMPEKDFAKKYPDKYLETLPARFEAIAGDSFKEAKFSNVREEDGKLYVSIELNGKKLKCGIPLNIEAILEKFNVAPAQAEETEDAPEVTEGQDPPAAEENPEEQETTPTPPPPGSPDRYKGENKPATTANWADLNGNYFEVIDEPDENGKIPTRPIHGKITVDGEAKNGENPKKFTITDQDNGVTYTFELDESVEGKVMYKCTSGKGAYTKGNSYELRTINGVPMLVQMKGTEGHGTAIGKNEAPAAPAPAEDTAPAEDAPPVEGAEPIEETPPTEDGDDAPPVEGKKTPPAKMTEEERQAKIEEDAASIAPDMTPKKKIDEGLKAKNDAISAALDEAPEVAKNIKAELEAFWTSNDTARTLLSKITPANATHVLAEYPELADKIDNVMGMDNKDVYKYVVTPLKTRLTELGLPDPYPKEGYTIADGADLGTMREWIKKATALILDAEKKIMSEYNNNLKEVKAEQEELAELKKAKPQIDAANKTLAEAVNANPPLKVEKDNEGDEVAKLPDGRRISVRRNDQGEITHVWIDSATDKDYDVWYASNGLGVELGEDECISSPRADFNKILELAKRIFGEKPAK